MDDVVFICESMCLYNYGDEKEVEQNLSKFIIHKIRCSHKLEAQKLPDFYMGISVQTHAKYIQPPPCTSSSLHNTNSNSKAHSYHIQELSYTHTHTHTRVVWLAREKDGY